MADVKDPKIVEAPPRLDLTSSRRELNPAYDKVRSDSDDLMWLLLDYESDKSNKLVLSATGSGDLAEFTSNLKPENASFGYCRVKYSNDDHSFREKFCLVTWIGEQVKVMRRARVSVHAADVKNVLRAYSIEVSASTPSDLKQDEIVQRMRRAGGANYDRSKFD